MRSRVLFAGLILSILALTLLLANANLLALRVLDSVNVSGITYDSESPQFPAFELHEREDPALTKLDYNPETGLVQNLIRRDFYASMTLNARTLHGLPNAFQTAPANLGLRLEFAPNLVALIAASHAAQGFDFIPVTTDFQTGVPHRFELLVDRENHVLIKLDGTVRVDATYPDLAYRTNEIIVGAGLSKVRPFNGRISNASISYGIYRITPNADSLRLDLEAIFLCILLTCGYFLLGPEGLAKIRWPWLSTPLWQSRRSIPVEVGPQAIAAQGLRRYAWPLPDECEAELLLDRREPTFQSLDFLASQIETLASSSKAYRKRTALEFAWSLPDGVGANVRLNSNKYVSQEALLRLAAYIRDFATFVDE